MAATKFDLHQEQLTHIQTRFIWLFISMLLISFSPSKALGQLIALICLGGLICYVQLQPIKHLVKYSLVLISYLLIGAIYYLLAPEFSFISFLLFGLTVSASLILIYDFRSIVSSSLLDKLAKITLIWLGFQAIFGVIQALVGFGRNQSFDIGNGDIVRGTIEPNFIPQASGGNVIFAILISTLLLFVWYVSRQKLSLTTGILFFLSLLAWLLASVLHTIIFFVLAGLVASILKFKFAFKNTKMKWASRGVSKRKGGLVIIILFMIFASLIILPTNLRHIPTNIERALTIRADSQSGKAKSAFYIITHLPEYFILQPVIGLGPGQYSSRASLIRSGQYLRINLPFTPYISEIAERYFFNLYKRYKFAGSSNFPYSSWLTVYSETGLMGLLAIILVFIFWGYHIRTLSSQYFPKMRLGILILLIYILLLGQQNNYWEFTQAILPAFLCLKLSYDYLRQEHDASKKLLTY